MIIKNYTLKFEAKNEASARKTAEAVNLINANTDNESLITIGDFVRKDPLIMNKLVKMLKHPMAGKVAGMFGIKL